MTFDRYHLVLATKGRPSMHGWWGQGSVARGKLRDWVAAYGTMPDARATLTDEETGETLTTWPTEA